MAAAATTNSARPAGIRNAVRSPDIQLAVGLIATVFIMIVPLHTLILDLLLTISITVSFIILLAAVYVQDPLEFSTFPTMLLLATLFRLALNVATTRSILLDGASGHVSSVVKAFGEFALGGDYFVGFVIFIILVVVNFVVITKGAGRVAEVGARFTLDAMPGKQMSIDADLNAGVIDREEAKRRRRKIEAEADFYGSMDGASKFVRGDAIAGILITAINIVCGLIIGVLQHNMSFSSAAKVFTILTVGDGLVAQIPALIISTAAGIIVTRASGANGLGTALTEQLLLHPRAIFVCSSMLALLAVIPGLPHVPFSILAVGFFFLGRLANREALKKAAGAKSAQLADAKDKGGDPIENLLHVDVLALEVGVGLIPLVDTQQDGEVLERIVSARKQFAQELGFIVPMVMVRDNIQLKPGEYQILLRGEPIGKGNLMVDYFLAMDPGDISDPIEGIKTKEPAYGLPALWIKASQRDEASFRGYTVVNPATVIVTHLTKVVQESAHLLIGRQAVQNLIDQLKRDQPKVVDEVVSADRLALGDVVKVLQNLLEEGVSARDLSTIFETLADHCKTVRNPDALTRYVRKSLGRGIIRKYLSSKNKLIVIALDRAVEDLLIAGLQRLEDGTTSLSVEPQIAQKLLANIAEALKKFDVSGTMPLILCGSQIRWDLRRLISRFIPGVAVVAFDEVPQDIQTETIAIVSLS